MNNSSGNYKAFECKCRETSFVCRNGYSNGKKCEKSLHFSKDRCFDVLVLYFVDGVVFSFCTFLRVERGQLSSYRVSRFQFIHHFFIFRRTISCILVGCSWIILLKDPHQGKNETRCQSKIEFGKSRGK